MNALVAPFPTNDGYLRRCAFGLAGRGEIAKGGTEVPGQLWNRTP